MPETFAKKPARGAFRHRISLCESRLWIILATMMHRHTRPLMSALALAWLALVPLCAPAAQVGWTAGGDGPWSVAGNWSGGALPTSTDFVDIGTALFPFAGTVSSAGGGHVAGELDIGALATLAVTGGSLAVVGTIDNHGTSTVTGAAAVSTGRVFNHAGASLTLSDAGTVLDIAEGMFNDGVLSLDAGALMKTGFPDGSVLSTASLTVTGGAAIQSRSMTTTDTATTHIGGAGTQVLIDNAIFAGGATMLTDNAFLEATSLDVAGSGLAAAGFTVDSGASASLVSGIVNGFGTLRASGPGALVQFAGDLHNVGGAIEVVDTGQLSADSIAVLDPGTLTIAGGGHVSAGSLDTDGQVSISGAGSELQVSGAWLNRGAASAAAAATVTAGFLDNRADLMVVDGAHLQAAAIANAGTLQLGMAGGAAATLVTQTLDNSANLQVSNGSQLDAAAFDNLAGASFLMSDTGSSTRVNGTLINEGDIVVGGASVLEADALIQYQGEFHLDGATLATSVAASIAGGQFFGHGNVSGNLGIDTGATASPGDADEPIGVLDISGDFATGGTLRIDIGGPLEGIDSDLFNVGGTAFLGGTVEASLAGGLSAVAGDLFVFLRAADVQFAFDTLLCPGCGALGLELVTGPDFAALGVLPLVIPIPAPAFLLAAPLLGLLAGARRRQPAAQPSGQPRSPGIDYS